MVKLEELKVEQLKKELAALGQKTTGTKSELVHRLRLAIEALGKDPNTVDFGLNSDDVERVGGAEGVDSAAIVDEGGDGIGNDVVIGEVRRSSSDENFGVISEFAKELKELKSYVRGVEMAAMQNLEVVLDKMNDMENRFIREIESLKRNCRHPTLDEYNVEVEGSHASTLKLKSPTFDGTTSFSVFKLQFETVAEKNNWSNKDKAVALIVALKGSAADVLQALPESGQREGYGCS